MASAKCEGCGRFLFDPTWDGLRKKQWEHHIEGFERGDGGHACKEFTEYSLTDVPIRTRAYANGGYVSMIRIGPIVEDLL